MSSKILLIDCDPRRSDRIAQPLARAGHEILRAIGGREGLRTFLKNRPSLVLIEAMLEREHGTEVCKKIRRTPAGRDVPIIVHSESLAGDELAHMLENSGCSVFLEMPCAGEQLLDVCEQLMPRNGGNGRKRTPLEDEELEEALDEFDSLLADQEGGTVDVDDHDLAAVDQAFEELTRPSGGGTADEAEIDSRIEEQLGEKPEPTQSHDVELEHEVDDRPDALAAEADDEDTSGDDHRDVAGEIDTGLEALSDELAPEEQVEDEQTAQEIGYRVDSLLAANDDELDLPIEGDDELEEKLETQLGEKASQPARATKDGDEPASADKPAIDAEVDAALAGKPDGKHGAKQTDDGHPDLIGIDDRSIDWKKRASGVPRRTPVDKTPSVVVQPLAEESAADESLEELSERFPGLVTQPKRPARWWLVGSMLVLAGVAAVLAVFAPHLSSMLMSDINRLPAERVDEKIEPLPAADPANRTEGELTDPATEGVAQGEPAAGELIAATPPQAATERDDAPASRSTSDTRPTSKPAPPPSAPAREAIRQPQTVPNREPLSTRNAHDLPSETSPKPQPSSTAPARSASGGETAATIAAADAAAPSEPKPAAKNTSVKQPEPAAEETAATEVAKATTPPPYQEPSRTAPATQPDYESETLAGSDRQLVAEEHGPSGDSTTPDAFRPPVALNRIAPSYSRKQLKGQEHAVVLRVLVSERGKVVRVVVKEGTRDSSLVASAIDAVLRYKYQPATENGDAVRAWTVEKLTFSP